MAGLVTSAETTWITSVVSSSLDQSLPWTRNTGQGTSSDGYGHSTDTEVSQGALACNVRRPSASVLQLYAGIIGSKRALTLRVLSTTTVRQGDHVTYDGVTWTVQALIEPQSYAVTKDWLITAVV